MKLMSFCQPRFILHRLGKQKRVIPTDIEFISICFAPAFRLYSVRLASAPLTSATSVLTSSLRTPKIFIKEFGDFLMSCHQHCLGVNLLVQR